MITIAAPLEVETTALPDGRSGWYLFFYTGRCCDFDFSFRDLLAQIASGLDGAEINLPDFVADENYVEGLLFWRGAEIHTYFEFELAYLSLASPDRAILDNMLSSLSPHIRVETPEDC